MANSSLRFIVENKIPFIKGLLEPYGKVEYLDPGEFTTEAVAEADALVVRTRTRCDASLLAGSKCQMIATATIGTDHIDLPWCQANGIEVANSPGCNAPAVAQYVFASILALSNRPACQHTIGIVGVGNVGKIVEKWARQLDMNVLLVDPPRQAVEKDIQWSSLQEVAEKADIITFHTPLDASTRHMADTAFFASLHRSPLIINSARGPVVDNQALVEALDKGFVHQAVVDCWENEPDISPDLLQRAVIATPHIAGYSAEGKIRATRMTLDAISKHFGLPHIEMPEKVTVGAAKSVNAPAIIKSYDPFVDTRRLKADPAAFETLRNTYHLRTEVGAAKID